MGGLRLSDFSDPGSPTPALIDRATSGGDAFVSEEADHDFLDESIAGPDSSPGSEDETSYGELLQSTSHTQDGIPKEGHRSDSTFPTSDLGALAISVEPIADDIDQTGKDSCILHLAAALSLDGDGSAEAIDVALQTTDNSEAPSPTEIDITTVQSRPVGLLLTHSIHAHGECSRTANQIVRDSSIANGSISEGPAFSAGTELDPSPDIVSDRITIAFADTTVLAEPLEELGLPVDTKTQHPVEMAQPIADTPAVSENIREESDSHSASEDDMRKIIVAPAEGPGLRTPSAMHVYGDVPPSKPSTPRDSAIMASPETSASSDSVGAGSSDNVSPLPQARGGFVVIPTLPSHLAFSMRAENGSPCKSLPTIPAPLIEVKAVSEPAVKLSTILSSPGSKDGCEIPREAEPSPSSTICRPRNLDQSSTTPPERVPAVKDDPFKCSTSSHPPGTADRPRPTFQTLREEKQAAARAVTIRNQLDTAFVSRLGPPQRMLLRSSSSSASSTARKPVSRTMPPTQSKDAEAPRSRLMTSSSSNSSAASVSYSGSSRAVKDILPSTAPTGSKLPTAMKASRAPLVPRNPIVPSAGLRMPLALGRPSNTRPTGNMPRSNASASMTKVPSATNNQANPLKRSLSTAPAHNTARSTVSVGYVAPVARPTLGLPSRTGRPVDLPVITTSGFTTGTCAAVTCSEPRSPMRTAPKKLLGTPSAPRMVRPEIDDFADPSSGRH